MLIVARGTVKHNGKEYQRGEILPELPAEDGKRLMKLGAVQCIPEEKPKEQPEGSAEESTGKTPENPEQAQAATGPEAEEPETNGETESLNLNADPAKVIQTGKKNNG